MKDGCNREAIASEHSASSWSGRGVGEGGDGCCLCCRCSEGDLRDSIWAVRRGGTAGTQRGIHQGVRCRSCEKSLRHVTGSAVDARMDGRRCEHVSPSFGPVCDRVERMTRSWSCMRHIVSLGGPRL